MGNFKKVDKTWITLGYRYLKLRKASKFYQQHNVLVEKYNDIQIYKKKKKKKKYWKFFFSQYRLSARWSYPPPLGNFADIPYLKEQSFLHRIIDVFTLQVGA